MASYCPHCGASAPDEARFCMKCGKERPADPATPDPATPDPATPDAATPDPAAPAPEDAVPAPPSSPPPPAYTPTAVSLTAPALPAPPAAPAGPAAPSPVGAFLGRTFRGDWLGSVQAALWPLVLLLTGSVALAIPAYGQDDDAVVDFTDRLRISLALLLQSVGGGFELSGREERPGLGGSDGLDGSGGLDGPGGLGGSGGLGLGSDGSASAAEGSASLHFAPLTMTVVFLVALFIGVRVLRTRLVARGAGQPGGTSGLEAAVRVALLVTVGVLGLALFAQPEIEGIQLSSSPVLAALGALLLGLGVSYGVLHRLDLHHWLAARPGAQSVIRAAGAAVRALAVVLALSAVVTFVCLTQVDDLARITDLDDTEFSPLLVAFLVLPNLAVTALGIGWGAGAEASVSGTGSAYGGGRESASFGLSELGDVTNDWAIVGALALGLVCALTIGLFAARRCAGRGEQLLAAGVFFGFFLLLAGFSGIGVELSGQALDGSSGFGGSGAERSGSVEAGLGVPEVLLFGLLWIVPAALLGPFLLRMAGQPGAVPVGPVPGYAPSYALSSAPDQPRPGTPPTPGTPPAGTPEAATPPSGTPAPDTPPPGTPPHGTPPPGTPPVGTPTPAYSQPTVSAYAPHAFQIGQQPQPQPQPPAAGGRGRSGIWVATLVGALVLGGGVAAGVLLWQDTGDDKADGAGKDDGPAVTRSEGPSPSGSASPSPLTSPTPSPSASTDPGVVGGTEVPAGTERVTDPEGFSFAVPDGWTRQSVNPERPGQITYTGTTGREEFLVGVVTDAPYTSYGNFTNIEKHTKSASDKSDYERIRLERNTFQGRSGAIWEYTYTDDVGRTIHALNQSYIAENGTEYAIQLSWREDFWSTGQGEQTHRTALDTWRLTG